MKSNLTAEKIEALAAALRAAKDSGALPPEEFRRLHESFRMTDLQGQEWSIGLKTFEWHRQDGGGWVREPHPARLLIETGVMRELQKLPRAAAAAPAPPPKTSAPAATASARRVAARARPEPEPEPEAVDDLACAKCGAEIEADDRFCGECGAPRKKAAKPPPRRPRPAASEEDDDEPFAPPPPRGRQRAARDEDEEEEPLPAAGEAPPPASRRGVGVLKIFWCSLMAGCIGLAFDWAMYESGNYDNLHLQTLAVVFGAITVAIVALAGAFRLVSAGAGAVYNAAILPLAFGALAFLMSIESAERINAVADLLDGLRGPMKMQLAMIAAASLVAFITFGFVLLTQRTFLLPLLVTLAALGLGGYALVVVFLQSQNDKFISGKGTRENPAVVAKPLDRSIPAMDDSNGGIITTRTEATDGDDGGKGGDDGTIPGNDNDGLHVIEIPEGVFEEAAKMGVPTPRPIGPNRNPVVVRRPQN